MHQWGDESVDWAGINGCCDIIYKYSKWGFIPGQIKEKYGTVRWYAMFGHLSLHALLYPGYIYCQFPKWLPFLWGWDIYYIGPFLRFLFERSFVWWQRKVYNAAYQKCLKAYPHLRAELLCGADHPELVKGATRIDGNKTHILGWNGEIISTWVSV